MESPTKLIPDNECVLTPEKKSGHQIDLFNDSDEEQKEGGIMENREADQNSQSFDNSNNLNHVSKDPQTDDKSLEQDSVQELTSTEKFFHEKWNTWMFKYKYVFFGITLVWLAFAIWRVSLFKSAKDPIQRLNEGHELYKLTQTSRNDFNSALNTGDIEVYLLWGIEDLDRSGIGRWEVENLGKLIYDSSFNLAPVANQQRILDICNNLKTRSLVANQVVTCWVQDFVDAQNGGSPVAEANFYTELETYLTTTTGQNQYNDNMIGYVNGELLFIKIVALTTEARFQGYSFLYPVYEEWEELKNEYNSASPVGVNNALQTAGYDWAWLVTEREMNRGAIQGIIISLAFALFVLIMSTYNVVIAVYAVMCIALIVLSVVAVMEMCGWGMGVIEAIAMVMIIGFSVDYVVHLANHYVECTYNDRYRRMQDALTGIGVSVVSGAISTIASGIFLFLAVIIFFLKFAVLVLATIIFSLYCSLVLFTCLNHAIGPQNNFGDIGYYIITPLKNKFKSACKKSRNEKED